jgi:hypothetical protein
MKVEARYAMTPDHTRSFLRGLVLQSESKRESALLDAAFGKKVGDDGLIGVRVAECRLSDGYAEHYVYIDALAEEPKPDAPQEMQG